MSRRDSRHDDIQLNDMQHNSTMQNDIHLNDTQNDSVQQNDTQHNDINKMKHSMMAFNEKTLGIKH